MAEVKLTKKQLRLLEKAYYAVVLGREDGQLLLNRQKEPEDLALVFSDVESLDRVFYDIGGMEKEEIEQGLEVLESLGLITIDKESRILKIAFKKARNLIFNFERDQT